MTATPPNLNGTKSGRLKRILNTQSDKPQAFRRRREVVGAVPVELPELLVEVLARHPASLEGMPTASKRSALAAAVWIAAMMPRHSRAGEVEAVLSQRTVQAMMRVGSSTLSLAVWALRDPQVAELLGWEWHPREKGQAWTVTITGWDQADRPQYLHIPIGATAPWEVLFYACMSLHAKRGRRVLISARQVWEQTQHLHQVSYRTWKRWSVQAREASWAEQPRRSCWTLAPERIPPAAQRPFLWAETRRRAQACDTPINREVPSKCPHLASASNSRCPRPLPIGHHQVKPGWGELLNTGEDLSPNTARPPELAPGAVTIDGLVWSVLERCAHPPSNIEELADWLYWLPWAADTTLRRPDGAVAEWPIRHQVPYTAVLARQFAADPVGELSGAVRAVAIGRWPPEEHGAWLTRCRRLSRAITTGQGVSAASREWWKHLHGLASQPIVQIGDREHHGTRSEILGPQNRATRPRSELTRVGAGQTPASGEMAAITGRHRPAREERPLGGLASPPRGQHRPGGTGGALRPVLATPALGGAVERKPHPQQDDLDRLIRRKVRAWLEDLEAAGLPLPSTQTVWEYVEALRRQSRND